MRLAMATGLLLALAARSAGQGADGRFAPTLPAGVGDVSRWLLVTGEFDASGSRGAYRLYVNPARQAMYQLMRYRVELLGGRTGAEGQRGSAERVAYVRRPGVPEPMLLWERGHAGGPPAWREIGAGTDEYRMELGVLMGVLAAHRAARAAQVP
jgi:hypothetical protein